MEVLSQIQEYIIENLLNKKSRFNNVVIIKKSKIKQLYRLIKTSIQKLISLENKILKEKNIKEIIHEFYDNTIKEKIDVMIGKIDQIKDKSNFHGNENDLKISKKIKVPSSLKKETFNKKHTIEYKISNEIIIEIINKLNNVKSFSGIQGENILENKESFTLKSSLVQKRNTLNKSESNFNFCLTKKPVDWNTIIFNIIKPKESVDIKLFMNLVHNSLSSRFNSANIKVLFFLFLIKTKPEDGINNEFVNQLLTIIFLDNKDEVINYLKRLNSTFYGKEFNFPKIPFCMVQIKNYQSLLYYMNYIKFMNCKLALPLLKIYLSVLSVPQTVEEPLKNNIEFLIDKLLAHLIQFHKRDTNYFTYIFNGLLSQIDWYNDPNDMCCLEDKTHINIIKWLCLNMKKENIDIKLVSDKLIKKIHSIIKALYDTKEYLLVSYYLLYLVKNFENSQEIIEKYYKIMILLNIDFGNINKNCAQLNYCLFCLWFFGSKYKELIDNQTLSTIKLSMLNVQNKTKDLGYELFSVFAYKNEEIRNIILNNNNIELNEKTIKLVRFLHHENSKHKNYPLSILNGKKFVQKQTNFQIFKEIQPQLSYTRIHNLSEITSEIMKLRNNFPRILYVNYFEDINEIYIDMIKSIKIQNYIYELAGIIVKTKGEYEYDVLLKNTFTSEWYSILSGKYFNIKIISHQYKCINLVYFLEQKGTIKLDNQKKMIYQHKYFLDKIDQEESIYSEIFNKIKENTPKIKSYLPIIDDNKNLTYEIIEEILESDKYNFRNENNDLDEVGEENRHGIIPNQLNPKNHEIQKVSNQAIDNLNNSRISCDDNITNLTNPNFFEKYNFRYLIQKCVSQNFKKTDFSYLPLINLSKISVIKDELSLANIISKESFAYTEMKEYQKLLNLSIKTTKYLKRIPEQKFFQIKNILSKYSNLVRAFYRFADMFANKNNYFNGLKWINQIYEYYKINNINTSTGKGKEEKEIVMKLEQELKEKRKQYLNNLQWTTPFNKRQNVNYGRNKYIINKQWYNDYLLYQKKHQNNQHLECNIPFPREIENHELLSGKEMMDDKQYILDKTKQNLIQVINEDEWNYLKDTYGYTYEIKEEVNKDDIITYKILLLNPNERENNLFIKPKYLQLSKTIDIEFYFKRKFNANNCRIFYYNHKLGKKERKTILFDIMYFYSLTRDNKIQIHSELLNEYKSRMSQKDELTEKFFFVDLGNFVQISFNNKCFYCQNNLGIIPCEECSINSFNNITYLFCSTACLTKHINNYHNQICVYQTFQYNKSILLKTTNNKERGVSVGLRNLGNTCFMNAVLQCLLHCDAFINYFIHEQYKREPLNSKNDQAITDSFVSFITGMIKNNRALYQSQGYNGMHTYNPSGLRKEILKKESKYNNNRQHDALEFFSDFLDLLSKEVNRSNSTIYDTKKNSLTITQSVLEHGRKLNSINSIVEDLFYGQLKNKFMCTSTTCQHVHNTFEQFLQLDLPMTFGKYQVIKFKYFKLGDFSFTYKEFEINKNFTVNDFKNEYCKGDFIFDVFILQSKCYQNEWVFLREIKKDVKIFELFDDFNFKLNNEIILFESVPNQQHYQLLFVYPFRTNISYVEQTHLAIPKDRISIMSYPIRIKLDKQEIININYWFKIREDLFNKVNLPVPALDKFFYNNGILFISEEKTIKVSQLSRTKTTFLFPYQENSYNPNQIYYLYLSNYSNGNINKYFNSPSLNNEELIGEKKINHWDLFKLFKNPKSSVQCKKCKDLTTYEVTISKLPVYLCVRLKRFCYDSNQCDFQKIETFIDFPDKLNMYSLLDKDKQNSFESKSLEKDCEYELFATIEHIGSILMGHYYANVKIKGKWFQCNDTSIFETSNYKNRNTLALFYKRISDFN